MLEIKEPIYMPPPVVQARVVGHCALGFDAHGRPVCGLMLQREPIQEILFGLSEQWFE